LKGVGELLQAPEKAVRVRHGDSFGHLEQRDDADVRRDRAQRSGTRPAVPGVAGWAAHYGDCASREWAQLHTARADPCAPQQRTEVRCDYPTRGAARRPLPGQPRRPARLAKLPTEHGAGEANARRCLIDQQLGKCEDVAAADRCAGGIGRQGGARVFSVSNHWMFDAPTRHDT